MAWTGQHSLRELLAVYRDAGVRRVELSTGHQYEPGVIETVRSFDFQYLLHNCFPPRPDNLVMNLASQNKAIVTSTLDHAYEAVALTAKWGATVYSIHAGWRFDPQPDQMGRPLKAERAVPYEAAYITFVESLQTLCDFAAPRHVRIAVEHHVLAPFNLVNGKNEWLLMCDADELERLLADVDRPNLGILLDVGHLNVTAKTLGFEREDFISRLADRVQILHLHDNDGDSDQHRAFDRGAWFARWLREFRDCPMVVECHLGSLDELRRCLDVVTELTM